MESLTKENFWDDLHKKVPDVVDLFYKWVDEYKAKGEWIWTIRENVKFHDLPMEMQVGIIARFFRDQFDHDFYLPDAGDVETIRYHTSQSFWEMFLKKAIEGDEDTPPGGLSFGGGALIEIRDDSIE